MDNPFAQQAFFVCILQRTIRMCQANGIDLIKNSGPWITGVAGYGKSLKSMNLGVIRPAIGYGFPETPKISLAFSNG